MSTAIPWLAFFGAIFAIAGTTGLISILIWLLVFLVACWFVFTIIGLLPLEQPWKQILTVIVCLILLLVLIQQLGFL